MRRADWAAPLAADEAQVLDNYLREWKAQARAAANKTPDHDLAFRLSCLGTEFGLLRLDLGAL